MTGGIFLLLGSNLGDRLQHLADATTHITSFANVIRRSSVYVSQPWGNTKQPDFLNQVLEVGTNLAPEILLRKMMETETIMGRNRQEKWGPRIIDIDLLFYRDKVVHTKDLVVPHPEIQNRKFTLVPMRELEPTLKHPVLKKTIAELDDECTDELYVKLLVS